jgi:hypothetical protein
LPAAIKHDVFAAITYAVQGVFWWAVPAAQRHLLDQPGEHEHHQRGRTAHEEKPATEMVG